MFRTPSKLVKRDADKSTSEEQRDKKEKEPEKQKQVKKERFPSPPKAEPEMSNESEFAKIPEKLPLLTADSYARWRYDIEIILRVRGLWRMTQGEEKPPATPDQLADRAAKEQFNKEMHDWYLKDNKAKEILTRSLDSRHHDMIRACKYAQKIWSLIKTLYEQNTGTSVLQVQREFHAMKWKNDDTVMGFFARLRTVANKSEALDSKITDTTIIAKVMAEAPAVYTPLKESWEVTMLAGTALTLDQLLGQMIRVEKSQPEKTKASSRHNHDEHSTALAVNQRTPFSGNCFNCGRQGHSAARCRARGGGAQAGKGARQTQQAQAGPAEQQAGPSGHNPRSSERANVGF